MIRDVMGKTIVWQKKWKFFIREVGTSDLGVPFSHSPIFDRFYFVLGSAEIFWQDFPFDRIISMELNGKSMVSEPANVIYLSTILGSDGQVVAHKCDWKCENEHVCGNMYRCKLTGITHICDKNCDQRILYDNHSSLCRASGQIFPLTLTEEQAIRGIRRKLDADNSSVDDFAFKRRRDAQFHPSPFERSFSAAVPICSQVGDGMDMS